VQRCLEAATLARLPSHCINLDAVGPFRKGRRNDLSGFSCGSRAQGNHTHGSLRTLQHRGAASEVGSSQVTSASSLLAISQAPASSAAIKATSVKMSSARVQVCNGNSSERLGCSRVLSGKFERQGQIKVDLDRDGNKTEDKLLEPRGVNPLDETLFSRWFWGGW